MPEPLLRGPRAHSVSWVLDDEYLEGTVVYHATEGADCRLVCPEGCESWIVGDHEHPLVDQGKCNAVEWFENDGVSECHRGKHPPVDGSIEIEFDDGWLWRYPSL